MAGPSHLSGAFWALRGRFKRCPPEVPEVAKARAGEGGADGIQVMRRKMRHVGPRPLARHKPLPGVFYTTPSREPNTLGQGVLFARASASWRPQIGRSLQKQSIQRLQLVDLPRSNIGLPSPPEPPWCLPRSAHGPRRQGIQGRKSARSQGRCASRHDSAPLNATIPHATETLICGTKVPVKPNWT